MKPITSVIVGLIAIFLWGSSVIIAIAEIIVVRDLIMQLYALLLTWRGAVLDLHGTEFWAGVSLQNCVVLILAIGVLVFAVATGEYHARHVGTGFSRRLFAWTFIIEGSLFAITYFV